MYHQRRNQHYSTRKSRSRSGYFNSCFSSRKTSFKRRGNRPAGAGAFNNRQRTTQHSSSTVKPWILNTIMKLPETSKWSGGPYAPYQLVDLPDTSTEYRQVEADFKTSSYSFRSPPRYFFRIAKIQRVENPYLLAQFLMKKEMMGVMERYLFHGTNKESIDGICKNNFNWRLRSGSSERKFGQGTSFSRDAFYATHYSNTGTMIYARVLVREATIGEYTTVVPPEPFDTTRNCKGTVTVKYDDDDFYPNHIIHYETIEKIARKPFDGYVEHFNPSRRFDHFDSSPNHDFDSNDGNNSYCSSRRIDDYHDMNEQPDDCYSNYESDEGDHRQFNHQSSDYDMDSQPSDDSRLNHESDSYVSYDDGDSHYTDDRYTSSTSQQSYNHDNMNDLYNNYDSSDDFY